MKEWRETAEGLSGLPEIAKSLLSAFPEDRIFAFYGDLGAGKTTFIKELAGQLGVEKGVSSPTFAIINEYFNGKESLFHFDFYRIRDVQEALQIGAEDYFYSGNYCFIEWAEKIEPLLPAGTVNIKINILSETKREFIVTK